MSNYQDRDWCDILDAAHIWLERPWLYDLDVTNLGSLTLMNLNEMEADSVEACQNQIYCRE